ncbi:MAG: hypothetical protein ABW321_36025 [Polyangiales bacterium]
MCQPASGCHPNGGLCRTDLDCCGAAGTGLPGDGNVRCEKEAGAAIGLCRNPTGCNPQGNVCHYKDYACSISSARNSCCAAPGNSGVCQLDQLGVPRCNGLGDTCRAAGETCASADDCCEDAPCVADDSGVLRCSASTPDGCLTAGDACTISADCCRGSVCVTELGSIRGTCSPSDRPAPAGAGGVSGAAGTSGTGGTSGAGASAPDAGTADAGNQPTTCAVYGQQCDSAADCCSGVPCTLGMCAYPLF